MFNPRFSSRTFALLALLTLLISAFGCNLGEVTEPEPTPGIIVTNPDIIILSAPKDVSKPLCASDARTVISAANGGVVANDFVSLEFPAGALSSDTEITIDMPDPNKLIVVFGPHGITFNKPVIMTFNLTWTNASGMADQAQTLWYNEEMNWWEAIEKVSSDDENKSKAVLWHFSSYKGTLGG